MTSDIIKKILAIFREELLTRSLLLLLLRRKTFSSDFIEHYVNLMKNDENVEYPQQAAWNKIISK